MRCLGLIVAAALLATAGCASQFPQVNLQATAPESLQSTVVGTLDTHLKPLASRRFGALQSSSSKDSGPIKQECYNNTEFLIEFVYFNGNCSDFGKQMDAIGNVDAYNTTSLGLANEACQSKCMARMKSILTNWGSKCFTKEGVGSLHLIQAMCSTDSKSGSICAATVAKPNGRCYQFYNDETNCNARSTVCSWNATTKYCDSRPAPLVVLSAYCESSCLPSLLKVYGEFFDSMTAIQAKVGLDLICLKFDDTYCYPLVNDLGKDLNLGEPSAKRPTFCNNKTAYACLSAYLKTTSDLTVIYAQSSLKSCLGNAGTATQTTKDRCLRSYASTVGGIDKLIHMIDILCQTNDGTATGQPCVALYMNLTSTSDFEACGKALDSQKTCSAECDTKFQTALKTLGCCAYPIGKLMANPKVDDERLPKIENATDLTLAKANSSAITTPWEMLKPCSGVQANATLTAKCVVSESARVKKSLKTSLSYAALMRDTALLARMKLAMRKDIAKSIYVSEDSITDDGFEEDTTRKVTVSASGSRKQTTQSNAANYKFTIAGADATSTSDASKAFDSKASSGTLSTTSTASEVSTCTGCADTSATSTGGLAVPSTPTSASGSLVAVATFAVAAVLALAL